MDAITLREERRRRRDWLRRAAWQKIAPDQVLDLEHLLDVMADPFGSHRGRLISRRWVAAAMKAAGASNAQVGAALDVDPDRVDAWIAEPLFAPPEIAAEIERRVLDELPDSLLTFPGMYGPVLEQAKAEAARILR